MTNPLYSPDGRRAVLFNAYEMRMSHWVEAPMVIETGGKTVLFSLGDFPWSADGAKWSADSRQVTLFLRRYPGDAPNVTVEVDCDANLTRIHAPGEDAAVSLNGAAAWLEGWYARSRK